MTSNKTSLFIWQSFIPYSLLLILFILLSVGGRSIVYYNPQLLHEIDFELFVLGSVLFIGFLINRIAPKTIIPSFVWVILAGMTLEPLLRIFTQNIDLLAIGMELAAAFVLFTGGIEIPFGNFKKWFFPIASLSLLGVMLTTLLFSGTLYLLTIALGIFDPVLIPSIIILSAALSSTDPTAIVPLLNVMKFKRNTIKEIAISESALTDISGSILTRFLLVAVLSTTLGRTHIFGYFAPLIQKDTYDAFALQIMSGILIGYFGYILLKHLYRPESEEQHSDPALFLSIPLFTYILGNALGGAGFLAAFIAGLLTDISPNLRPVARLNESILIHLIYPFVFIMLGALVPIEALITYAPLGLLASIIFMVVIRPIVVFGSLFPWIMRHEFRLAELVFLSCIRETGIIAAILLVIASSYQIIVSEFILAIGMWVILLTLVIEPPLTPILARKIGITRD